MEKAERRNGEWKEEFFDALPGGQIIRQGMADLQRGARTVPALLVQVGGSRFRHLKLPVPHPPAGSFPEHELYDLLSVHDPNSAHSRYNALLRLLVSFERAAECATKSINSARTIFSVLLLLQQSSRSKSSSQEALLPSLLAGGHRPSILTFASCLRATAC